MAFTRIRGVCVSCQPRQVKPRPNFHSYKRIFCSFFYVSLCLWGEFKISAVLSGKKEVFPAQERFSSKALKHIHYISNLHWSEMKEALIYLFLRSNQVDVSLARYWNIMMMQRSCINLANNKILKLSFHSFQKVTLTLSFRLSVWKKSHVSSLKVWEILPCFSKRSKCSLRRLSIPPRASFGPSPRWIAPPRKRPWLRAWLLYKLPLKMVK